jgi:hypothetical protein
MALGGKMAIVLKLNLKTAKRLSYAVGRSDEANAVVQAATNAARAAEKEVRDLISLVADQQEVQLPPDFGIKFEEDTNEITITSKEPPPFMEIPEILRMNGVQEQSNG